MIEKRIPSVPKLYNAVRDKYCICVRCHFCWNFIYVVE